MNVDCSHQEPHATLESSQKISLEAAANEVNIWMASEIVNATDRIARRMLKKVHLDLPSCSDQIVANILNIRREILTAAARIVERCALDKEERISRVREALDLDLRVAAAFLLKLVDEPGLVHGQNLLDLSDDGHRRRMAVYASHIRRALRAHGLEAALITVRSRGYLIAPSDADRIRMLWGELS